MGLALGAPNVFDGYVKCADGSSPQKDDSGRTLACQPGQQTYAQCQPSYQCTTPLPGRPGVCCKPSYVSGAGTEGPPTYAPPPVTGPPPPPVDTAPPPPPVETVPPPPPVETVPPTPPVETVPPPPQTASPLPPPESPPPPNTDQPATDSSVTPGSGGNGIELTPPPPTDFTGGVSTDMTPGGEGHTDTSTAVSGGSGGGELETTYPTVPPEILETTTNIDSVDVITDSSGSAIVSPHAVAENRKGNRTASSSDSQRQRGHGHGRGRHTPPAPSANASTKVSGNTTSHPKAPSANGHSGSTSTLKPTKATDKTTTNPPKSGRPLASVQRFSN
jgi:hypothetical protein